MGLVPNPHPEIIRHSVRFGCQLRQAINRSDPDYFPLLVLNRVIGGGPTGRLFRHLREAKGYTYGAGSNVLAPPFRGVWVASTNVRTEVPSLP